MGGIIGGIATNWQSLYNKINGTDTLHIDNPTLTLIAARALALLGIPLPPNLQWQGGTAE